MCNINRDLEAQLLGMGLNLIGQAMEASLREYNPIPTTDVLEVSTKAYQQGKITKSQLMGIIDALDETPNQSKAYAEPSWNREYLDANNYLNQYRR
ncbi:MAG: hypothetical protein QNJ72_25775 [Pleurocapsa sp. MO_226.B13]|nr:hypothetical protein [Pleurocapsa sp. MO_226.B13]